MQRDEGQVRFELIDPALEDRGWNRRTDIRVEETAKPIDIINHQPRKRPAGRTDYVLRRPLALGTEPLPLAILEAKHEGLPPEHGLQQGKGYRIGQLMCANGATRGGRIKCHPWGNYTVSYKK